jgi:hypothetical protein
MRVAAPRRMKKILNLCESVESVVYVQNREQGKGTELQLEKSRGESRPVRLC